MTARPPGGHQRADAAVESALRVRLDAGTKTSFARIQDRSVQSVTTSLSTATLSDVEIPLPPLADQERILSALQSLDEQAAAIERRLNAARNARTAFARHLTDGTVILAGGEPGE